MLYFAWGDEWRSIEWGDRRVLIPLLIISGAVVVSGLTASTWGEGLAQAGLAMSFVVLYLASRKLGGAVLAPLAIGAAVASVGVIASAVLHPGHITGGLVFGGNYDIVVGYTLLGALAWQGRYRRVLIGAVAVSLLLTGSPEALFGLGVLGVTLVWRRDWMRKTVAASFTIMLAVFLYGFLVTPGLYDYAAKVAQGQPVLPQAGTAAGDTESAVGYRIGVVKDAMTHVRPLGDGLIIGTGIRFNNRPDEYWKIVHNAPLVIVQQLGWPGIAAAFAWLWVAVRCLVKTKAKYLWVLVLGLSIWDNYVWVQMAPLFWVLVGTSTAMAQGNVKSDLIFKK